MNAIPAAELWRRVAVITGVDATYGVPFGALEVVPVEGTAAPLFARAHQRVHGSRAAVHQGDGVFWLPGLEPGPCLTVEVDSAEALVASLAHCLPERWSFTSPSIPLSRSKNRPSGPGPLDDNWLEPADETVETVRTAATLILLAGPGVVSRMAVPGLHDLAVSAGIGVLNTWGAKGVFDWRSQHHLATIGLQSEDFVLSGLDEADLIIATGLDRDESPEERWRLAPALTIPPAGLAPLAERCGAGRRTP